MSRPDFELLYKRLFRRHHELLNKIEDLTERYRADDRLTGEDYVGAISQLHGEYTSHDWEH